MQLKNFIAFCAMGLAILACEKEETTEEKVIPAIASVSPSEGPVGTLVTIRGTDFSNADSELYFAKDNNSVQAAIESATSTEIKVKVPSNLALGTYTLQLISNDQTIQAPEEFKVVRTPHTVTGLSSTSLKTDQELIIQGTNFSTTASENLVKLSNTEQNITVNVVQADAESLTVNLPSTLNPGIYTVSVTIENVTIEASEKLTIKAPRPQPVVSSVNPAEVYAGNTITISGTDFAVNMEDNTVLLIQGNIEIQADVKSATETTIEAVVPESAADGEYILQLTSDGVSSTDQIKITVKVPHTITSLTPTSAEPGSSIEINGSNFGTTPEAIQVSLYQSSTSQTLTVIEAQDTKIIAQLPNPINAGQYNLRVTIDGLEVSATEQLTITEPRPLPVVSSVNPAEVYAGNTITISGTDFAVNMEDNTVLLIQGSVELQADVKSATETTIEALVPANAAGGEYIIQVTSEGKISTNVVKVMVKVPHAISSFTPTSPEPGSYIEINGSNFGSSLEAIKVSLYQSGFIQSLTVIDIQDTKIIAQLPANVFSGQHSLRVTLNGLVITATEKLTIGAFSTPVITTVSKTTLQTNEEFTITGENFSYEPEVLYVVFIQGTIRKYASIIASSPTEIVANAPGFINPGTYTLQVFKGNEFDAYSTEITIVE